MAHEQYGRTPVVNEVFPQVSLSAWVRSIITVFAVALIIRGAFIFTLQDGFYFPDSVDYSAAAVNLIAHGEFGETYRRAPVYPVFLAGIFILFGQKIIVIRLVEALLGACLGVIIAIIGKQIGGEKVGALAGLLWSIYPLAIFIAALVYPTNMATMLLACAVLCMMPKADQDLTARHVLIGGILFGFAVLTVPVALVTVVAIALWILYWQNARRLLLATLFLFGVALPLTPWTVRNFYVYGRLVAVEPRLVEQLPSIDNSQKNGHGNKVKMILENPGTFARRFVTEFGYFWELHPQRIKMNEATVREELYEGDPRIIRETLFGTSWTSLISVLSVGPMFLFALIGTAAMCLQKQRRRALSLLCITILSFAFGYSLFWAKMRYRIPVEPFIMILSAFGLRRIWIALPRAPERAVMPDGEKV
jgi:4-amino-4-deoxy-L-arabinose transferase-like glycosyltransferase